jgi:glycosyltransferase involved in cell wall biosynthesis
MRLKIIQITNYFPPHYGGIEKVSYDVGNILLSEHSVINLCFNDKNSYKEEISDNNLVIRCNIIGKISSQQISLNFGRVLKRIVNEFNPDVIHFHFPNPLQAYHLLRVLKKRQDIKLIVHYHLDITKQKILKHLFVNQTKKLLDRAVKVIATSPNYVEDSIFLDMIKDKVKIIPNTFNEKLLNPSENTLKMVDEIKEKYKNKHLVFFVGRHVEYKGLTYLIKASKFLSDKYQIIIAGSGPLTKELSKNTNPIIEFIGPIDDELKHAYLLACSCFAFPSITKNEAFGIALLEAMISQKPSVTFRVKGSGISYVCPNNVCGKEARLYDCKEFASNIEMLCNDQDLNKMLGLNAYNRALRLFSIEVFNEAILKLYGDEI